MAYRAYMIPGEARAALLAEFPPPPGMEAVCEHVTRVMDPGLDAGGAVGAEADIVVVGRFTDDGNDVLAVTVDGEHLRPDGLVYHVTMAVDRARGGRPARSNELVLAAYRSGGTDALETLARPRPVGRVALREVEGAKTPRKQAAPRPAPPPAAVTDLGGGLTLETTDAGAQRRMRYVADGTLVAVVVEDKATGRRVVDKGVFAGAPTSLEAIERWRASVAPPAPAP